MYIYVLVRAGAYARVRVDGYSPTRGMGFCLRNFSQEGGQVDLFFTFGHIPLTRGVLFILGAFLREF